MAKVETYSCDQCGAQKTKGNGWFCAWLRLQSYFYVFPFEKRPTITVVPDRAEEKHYCSESCVAKAFSKTMGSGILAASADSNS